MYVSIITLLSFDYSWVDFQEARLLWEAQVKIHGAHLVVVDPALQMWVSLVGQV